jgi:predicted transcriptional regulator
MSYFREKTHRTEILSVRARKETHKELKRIADALDISQAQAIEDALVLLAMTVKPRKRAA